MLLLKYTHDPRTRRHAQTPAVWRAHSPQTRRGGFAVDTKSRNVGGEVSNCCLLIDTPTTMRIHAFSASALFAIRSIRSQCMVDSVNRRLHVDTLIFISMRHFTPSSAIISAFITQSYSMCASRLSVRRPVQICVERRTIDARTRERSLSRRVAAQQSGEQIDQ